MKVAVAMSGGVDSSVAAAILLEEGYEVIGMTMRTLPASDIPDGACSVPDAVEDARRVAETLGIPHHTIDLSDLFREAVIDYFAGEYRRGRTPNPCVHCNRLVKFGALMRAAFELGAERLATGHYAKIEHKERYLLKRGLDRSKDQTYALYRLTQEQLARTLFPLGNLAKDETRRLAETLGLSMADKPDSQEICFIPEKDYPAFLAVHAPETVSPGPLEDTEGRVIGEHPGIAFFTVGQRKRLGVSRPEPTYVVRIVPERRAVVVGRNEDLFAKSFTASELNFISIEALTAAIAVTCKIRYNMKDTPALLTPLPGGRARVIFNKPERAITPGQASVFYQEDEVVGGGTID
ncbi:MAG: tRNA 2-thiouridine(34) synthase MnmA [Armatimonadota bacterium]